MVEGQQFLIQSPSPDWVRRKIFLSDLRDSAVNLIFKEGILAKESDEINYVQPFLDSSGELCRFLGFPRNL